MWRAAVHGQARHGRPDQGDPRHAPQAAELLDVADEQVEPTAMQRWLVARGVPVTKGVLDYAGFDVLTFDCYGTLIDWNGGITIGSSQVGSVIRQQSQARCVGRRRCGAVDLDAVTGSPAPDGRDA